MDDIDIDSVVNQFLEELLRPVFGLHENQHRRIQTLPQKSPFLYFPTKKSCKKNLLDHCPEGEQFSLLGAHELELLVDEVNGRVADADVDADEVLQVAPTPVGHGRGVRGAEHGTPHSGTVTRLVQLGQLLSESLLALLKQLVALVHHQPLHAANIFIFYIPFQEEWRSNRKIGCKISRKNKGKGGVALIEFYERIFYLSLYFKETSCFQLSE